MRIKAQFNSKCAGCGRPIKEGTEIEYVNRKGHHVGCEPIEQASLTDLAEGAATCEALRFRTFDELEREGIPDIWKVPFLCPRTGSPD